MFFFPFSTEDLIRNEGWISNRGANGDVLQDQSLDPRVQDSYQISFQVAEMSRLQGFVSY